MIHINNILNVIDSKVTINRYANDCVFFAQVISRADQTSLNDNLDKSLNWCGAWGMDLNIEKCFVLQICNRKTAMQLSFSRGEVLVKKLLIAKYLRVTIAKSPN